MSVMCPAIYRAVFISLLISLLMIASIFLLYLIIIIKSELWNISHCFRIGHKTTVCAVCLAVFLQFVADSGGPTLS